MQPTNIAHFQCVHETEGVDVWPQVFPYKAVEGFLYPQFSLANSPKDIQLYIIIQPVLLITQFLLFQSLQSKLRGREIRQAYI